MQQETTKSLEITTDGVWHELRTRHELPLAAQREFDYAPESDEPRFVLVGDDWYDTLDTQRISTQTGAQMGYAIVVKPEDPLAQWDAIVTESYWSGKLFKFGSDDTVMVGRYAS